MNRPLISVAAALVVLGGLLVAQHFVERGPDASLSALSAAVAEPIVVRASSQDPASTPVENGIESTMASDAIGAVGGR
jgi:hypothetical protein